MCLLTRASSLVLCGHILKSHPTWDLYRSFARISSAYSRRFDTGISSSSVPSSSGCIAWLRLWRSARSPDGSFTISLAWYSTSSSSSPGTQMAKPRWQYFTRRPSNTLLKPAAVREEGLTKFTRVCRTLRPNLVVKTRRPWRGARVQRNWQGAMPKENNTSEGQRNRHRTTWTCGSASPATMVTVVSVRSTIGACGLWPASSAAATDFALTCWMRSFSSVVLLRQPAEEKVHVGHPVGLPAEGSLDGPAGDHAGLRCS
mmetsp:Transcript_1727/g.5001  ORF Transcript_1727/g.5001 Transcript_1727/m.5001 type:complete len:258 (+) Transcript_1727:626-1399(+)